MSLKQINSNLEYLRTFKSDFPSSFSKSGTAGFGLEQGLFLSPQVLEEKEVFGLF